MNRVFLLQTEIGIPDPWDDSLNMANIGINPGLGYSNNATGYDNYISFFQKVDNRFAIGDPTSSTTWSESTFTASGLSTKSQSLNFGASVSGATNTFTQTNYQANQLIQ